MENTQYYWGTNRILLIVVLVLTIIFIVLSISFIFVPAFKIQNTISTINDESKEAAAVIEKTAGDIETTLTILNSVADETSQLETTILGLIGAACTIQTILFDLKDTQFCKNFNG